MNIKIFSFQKDEELLEHWIKYHGNIFGYNNLHIIDHNSDLNTLKIYEKYKEKGLNIKKFKGSFSLKAIQLTKWMKEFKKSSDFLIPLDGDEFISLNNNDNIIQSKNEILNYFKTLLNINLKLKFKTYDVRLEKMEYDDIFLEGKYFERHPMRPGLKTFYPSSNFISTDQGNHVGKITGNNKKVKCTNLMLLHYACKGYSNYIKKIERGIKAYNINKNKTNHEGAGSNWFNMYKLYTENKLERHFKEKFMYNLNKTYLELT